MSGILQVQARQEREEANTVITLYADMRRDFAGSFCFNKETVWTGDPVAELRSRRVLVLVHGVKNTKNQIRNAYREISMRSTGSFDAMVGVMWPGGVTPFGWPIVSTFDVTESAIRLARILERISFEGQPASIDIDAHSLGCPIAMKAVEFSLVPVDGVWLMAPAMSRSLERYRHLLVPPTLAVDPKIRRGAWVFYSRRDLVLRALFQIWPPFLPALGAYGEKSKGGNLATNIDCTDAVKGNHTGYRHISEVVQEQTNDTADRAARRKLGLTPRQPYLSPID